MLASLLADLVLLLHLAFVLFVVLGGLLVFRYRRLAWLHLPMMLWAAIVNLSAWHCPLTPLENHFRLLAGQAGYQGGFLAHYLLPLIYPAGMGWNLGLVIGVSVLVWNALVYGVLLLRRRGR